MFSPCVTSSPSQPTVVVTTGLAIARASRILSRVPPPSIIGQTNTVTPAIHGRMSSVLATTTTLGSDSRHWRREADGFMPATYNFASGHCPLIRGQIPRTKYRIAEMFGYQFRLPEKIKLFGLSGRLIGRK